MADETEPGLLYRRLGSRRDGRQEIIEAWDTTHPKCPVVSPDKTIRTVILKHWIAGIAADGVQLYEKLSCF